MNVFGIPVKLLNTSTTMRKIWVSETKCNVLHPRDITNPVAALRCWHEYKLYGEMLYIL